MSPAIQEYFTDEEIAFLQLQLREGVEAAQAAAKRLGWKVDARRLKRTADRQTGMEVGR